MFIAEWQWDDGNVEHIGEHGVSPRDIIDVLAEQPKFRRNRGGRAATHQMVGPDRGGSFIAVFIVQIDDDAGLWRVVTARRATDTEVAWWRKS